MGKEEALYSQKVSLWEKMVKKGIEPNPAHKTYLIVGVSLIVLVLFSAIYLYVVPKGMAEKGVVGKATASCAEAPAGILYWWKGEGDAKATIGGVEGTAKFGVRYDPGKVGKAFYFSGSDDPAVSGNQFPFIDVQGLSTPTTAISVEAWVKSDDSTGYPGAWQIISNYNAFLLGNEHVNSNLACFIIAVEKDNPSFHHWIYDTCYPVTDPDKWHHLVGTFDSTGKYIRLYVDGVQRDERSWSGGQIRMRDSDDAELVACTGAGKTCRVYTVGIDKYSSGNLNLGHHEYFADNLANAGAYFKGFIDEVTIYNRALTAEEVEEIYDAGAAGKCVCEAGEISSDKTLLCTEEKRDWVKCTNEINGQLEGKYICKGTDANSGTWIECTQTKANSGIPAVGNFVCREGQRRTSLGGTVKEYQWVNCDDIPELACLSDGSIETCNLALKDALGGTEPELKKLYCSLQGQQYSWKKCSEKIAGEGVENAVHIGHTGRYVCNGNAWESINCLACFGTGKPGQCVGSSILDVNTGGAGTPETSYYYAKPGELVGCVSATATLGECYRQVNGIKQVAYPFDSGFYESDTEEYPSFVCGNDHNFLKCPADINRPYASDGGQWLCLSDNPGTDALNDAVWYPCSSEAKDAQLGTFKCQFSQQAGEEAGKWRWVSISDCTPTTKYMTRSPVIKTVTETVGGVVTSVGKVVGYKYVCDGKNWIGCDDLSIDPLTGGPVNPFANDTSVYFECVNGHIVLTELACEDKKDNDRDGFADCREAEDCLAAERTLKEDETYEIRLEQQGCLRPTVKIGDSEAYKGLYLCDRGTEFSAREATLCGLINSVEQTVALVESTPALLEEGSTPLSGKETTALITETAKLETVSFLYEPTGTKAVSLILTKDVGAMHEFPISEFQRNLVGGQRLFVVLDKDYYLLSWKKPAGENVLFDEDDLVLKHVPGGEEFPARQYAGTSKWSFTVRGGKVIVLELDRIERIYKFSSVSLYEIPAALSVPVDLTQRYEATITPSAPARMENLPVSVTNKVYYLCRQDVSEIRESVALCSGPHGTEYRPFANFAKDTLRKKEMGDVDYAFLYQFVNNTKQVSVFLLKALSGNNNSDTVDATLDAPLFARNLVAGRRLAFSFEAKTYLLSHPVSTTLSLPSLKLTLYEGGSITDFSALGGANEVEFTVPDGKIYIKADYATDDSLLSFQVTALTKQQVIDRPLNLNQQWSTSFSSEVPVKVSSPQLGIIHKVEGPQGDLSNLQESFLVQGDDLTGTGGNQFLLNYQQPYEKEFDGDADKDGYNDKVLFYYRSAEVRNRIPIKTVDVYKVYDFVERGEPFTLSLTNEFIQTLTSGKQLAFRFADLDDQGRDRPDQMEKNDAFYVLSFEGGSSTDVQFFSLAKLRLRRLGTTQMVESTVEGTRAWFILPEGKFFVELQRAGTQWKIIFSKPTEEEILQEVKFDPAFDYSFVITTKNKVEVKDTGAKLSLCSKDLYAQVSSAEVCGFTDAVVAPQGSLVLIEPTVVYLDNNNGVRDDLYLLELNGQTGDLKQVKLHRIIEINEQQRTLTLDDWGKFTQHIAAADLPVFNVSNKLYLPAANNNLLSNFVFVKYPVSAPFTIRDWRAITPITSNGSYVLEEKVIFVKQELTGSAGQQKVKAQMELKNYAYLPDDQSELLTGYGISELPASKRFITNLRGAKYNLRLNGVARDKLVLVEVWQEDAPQAESVKINRYFAQGETKTLVLDGTQVEIKVAEIKENTAKVSIKRSS